MKQIFLAALALAGGGCVTAPVEFCPGYAPAHKLTDDLLASYNANVKLWAPGTTQETDQLKAAGWSQAKWDERRVVICTRDTVYMRAFLAHYRADGSKIRTGDYRYTFRRKESGWIIEGKTDGAL